MKEKKLIHFDFDGVIIDSFKVSFEIWKSLVPEALEEDYRMYFAGNVYENIRLQSSAPIDEIKPKWGSLYDKKVKTIGPVPRMTEVIKLMAQKYPMNIVTSGSTKSVRTFLKKYDLEQCFHDILGFEVHESKHEKMEYLLNKHGVRAKDSVLITDTLGDLAEAQLAEVPAIAVTWGFHDRSLLQKGNPTAIVDTPEQLLKLFI